VDRLGACRFMDETCVARKRLPSEYWTSSRFGKNFESIGSATWCRDRGSPPKSASGTHSVFTLLNSLKSSRHCVLRLRRATLKNDSVTRG
jgi:hypothetical protein